MYIDPRQFLSYKYTQTIHNLGYLVKKYNYHRKVKVEKICIFKSNGYRLHS